VKNSASVKQNNSVCNETRYNFTNDHKRRYVKDLQFVLYHSHGKLYFTFVSTDSADNRAEWLMPAF